VEELKRYRLVADEWTSETGDLSPTQKLKRNVLAAKYSKIIEEIFTASHEEDSKGFKIKIPRINLTLSELINRLKTYANSINGNGNGH